jgi:hypothetical protein
MYGTARSPRESNTGTPSDATLCESGPDGPVHDDMVADPHLRDEASGVLTAKRAPVRRDGRSFRRRFGASPTQLRGTVSE